MLSFIIIIVYGVLSLLLFTGITIGLIYAVRHTIELYNQIQKLKKRKTFLNRRNRMYRKSMNDWKRKYLDLESLYKEI